MAEIKSTMDLVMERAARIGRASKEEMQQEETEKKGMQLAAEYLEGKLDQLSPALASQPAAQQLSCRQGMLTSLVRNIFLGRDQAQAERITKALHGILELGGGAGDLKSICGDLQHILGQYDQHRQQIRQQLEQQFRTQIEHLMARQGAAAKSAKIDPTMHPKFAEEWSRVESDLNGQYNQAIEQNKTLLRQRLGI